MTIHVKPEALIARHEIGIVTAVRASGDQRVALLSPAYVRLLPFMIFCFGMLIAAIPMMLG
jgi:hypothetical protein